MAQTDAALVCIATSMAGVSSIEPYPLPANPARLVSFGAMDAAVKMLKTIRSSQHGQTLRVDACTPECGRTYRIYRHRSGGYAATKSTCVSKAESGLRNYIGDERNRQLMAASHHKKNPDQCGYGKATGTDDNRSKPKIILHSSSVPMKYDSSNILQRNAEARLAHPVNYGMQPS
jgi:hypothetical protein